MRQRLSLKVGLAAVAALMGAASPALAQIVYDTAPRRGYYRQAPPPQPGYGQPPAGYYYQQPAPPPQRRVAPGQYYPGMLVQPAPQPQPGFSLRRLFGYEEEQRPASRPAPRQAPRPKPAPVQVAKPDKPKVNPSTHLVVFGDSYADLTGQGLDDVYAEAQDVAVARKVRADGGLTRSEPGEWPKFIQDTLNGGQKITVAVLMLGANDRQAIREGETTHEPLSERWKQIYRERVDAVVRVFQERAVPVVWVGVPPMRNDKLSADYIAMNEIYRDSVQRAGGTYVDVWPGFVNDENRYTATGPDVDGQPSRLRNNDGLFTKAGARKAAHFADAEIKRILEGKRTGTAVAATPPVEGASVDQMINAALPALPEPAGTPPLASKPLVGPVLPLTRPEVAPGGTLISGRPRLDGDATYGVQKALREGVAPSPRPGRADDFRWPRS
ncbi:MAG TPA: GDSL-type esterase/lipase family protein [Microvirga sp.]|jgi:hypothetical protein